MNIDALSIKSQISNFSLVPIISTSSDHCPRTRLIRSNFYTLDEPSPAFLKHFQQQAQHSRHPNDDKQEDHEITIGLCCARRKSLDNASNINTIKYNNKRLKMSIFKKTPGNGVPTFRRARPVLLH